MSPLSHAEIASINVACGRSRLPRASDRSATSASACILPTPLRQSCAFMRAHQESIEPAPSWRARSAASAQRFACADRPESEAMIAPRAATLA
jgi:hypothetical protein